MALILATPALCLVELVAFVMAGGDDRRRWPRVAAITFLLSLLLIFLARATAGGDNDNRNLAALVTAMVLLVFGGASVAIRGFRGAAVGVPLAVPPAWLWLVLHTTGP